MPRVPITVIIPTRNRADLLYLTLQRLLEQIGQKDQIIVVDNASTDNTKKVIKHLSKKTHKIIEYLYVSKIGPSYARNRAVKLSKYDILAFLDDDCLIYPNWVKTIKNISKKYLDSKIVFQGKVNHITLYNNLTSRLFHERSKIIMDEIKKESLWNNGFVSYINAGNFFINKRLITWNKFFDENLFPLPGGEEVDLAYRLQRTGCSIKFVKQLEVNHIKVNKPPFARLIKNAFNTGRTEGIISEKYLADKKLIKLFKKDFQLNKHNKIGNMKGQNPIFREKLLALKSKYKKISTNKADLEVLRLHKDSKKETVAIIFRQIIGNIAKFLGKLYGKFVFYN